MMIGGTSVVMGKGRLFSIARHTDASHGGTCGYLDCRNCGRGRSTVKKPRRPKGNHTVRYMETD